MVCSSELTVLITGSGLIGTQIARQFIENGETAIVYDISPQLKPMSELIDISKIKIVRGDVLDFPNLASTLKENQVDKIVHTAALLPGGLMKSLYNGIRVNTDGTLNVLEAMRLTGAKRLVYTSTVGVYSKDAPGEYFEEDISEIRPGSLYGATKLMSEYMGINYARTFGIDFRIVRFANIIGPWSGDIQTGTGGFVKQLLEGALSGKDTHIQNPFPMVLEAEWVYSIDAAVAVWLLMNKDQIANNVFNIGTGKVTKAEEIIASIQKLIPSARTTLGSAKPMAVKPMSISRAKQELGWSPQYDLNAMTKSMIDWYRIHPPTPRN